MYIKYMKGFIFLLFLLLIGAYFSISDNSYKCEKTWIDIALQTAASPSILFASFNERHRFAKGKRTRYGRLTFDSDLAIRVNCRWSNRKLHNVGFIFQFSNKLNR